jgi:hypothetical protein
MSQRREARETASRAEKQEESTVMLNEGFIHADSRVLVKSEMVRQLHRLGPTTPREWEGAVFAALTGGSRDDIDWDVEDNKAGYFLWVKTFDELIVELEEDGYVAGEEADGGRVLRPVQRDDTTDLNSFVYPARS